MVTLAVVAPIARYRHAHTSNRVLPRSRGRWTSPPTARGAARRPSAPAPSLLAAARTLRPGSASSGGMAISPTNSNPSRGRDGGAQLVDRIRTADVHTAPRLVAVEAELEVDPQRLGPAPLVQRLLAARSSAAITLRAVDRVRGVRPAGDRPRFVALNPPDHVPANRLSAQHGTRLPRFYSTLPVRGIRQIPDTLNAAK